MDLLTLIAKLAEADFGRLVGVGIVAAILVWLRIGTLNAGIRKLQVEYERERSKSDADLDAKRIEQDRDDSVRQFEANKLLAASNNRLADVINMTVTIMGRVEARQVEDSGAIKIMADNYDAVRVKANIIHERTDAIHRDMIGAFKATGEHLVNKSKADKLAVGETNLLIGSVMKEIESVRTKVDGMTATLNKVHEGVTGATAQGLDRLRTELGSLNDKITTFMQVVEQKRKGTGELKPDPIITPSDPTVPPPPLAARIAIDDTLIIPTTATPVPEPPVTKMLGEGL